MEEKSFQKIKNSLWGIIKNLKKGMWNKFLKEIGVSEKLKKHTWQIWHSGNIIKPIETIGNIRIGFI